MIQQVVNPQYLTQTMGGQEQVTDHLLLSTYTSAVGAVHPSHYCWVDADKTPGAPAKSSGNSCVDYSMINEVQQLVKSLVYTLP